MKYKGSCHCGKVAFEAEGEIKGGDGMQLFDVFAQRIALVVCAARTVALCSRLTRPSAPTRSTSR